MRTSTSSRPAAWNLKVVPGRGIDVEDAADASEAAIDDPAEGEEESIAGREVTAVSADTTAQNNCTPYGRVRALEMGTVAASASAFTISPATSSSTDVGYVPTLQQLSRTDRQKKLVKSGLMQR